MSIIPQSMLNYLSLGKLFRNSSSSQLSNATSITNKPKLVKYYINKKQAGLGSRIVRQHVEVTEPQEDDKPMETVKSFASLSRPRTEHSNKTATRYLDIDRLTTPKGQVRPSEVIPIIEYQYIDEIPLDHPIWKQILPDEPTMNIPKLIAENPEYFHHQLGLCACFKCQCGNCKCNFAKSIKFNIGQSQATVYGKDFLHKNNQFNHLLPLNQPYYSTKFDDQKTIDLQSQHRHHYKQCKITALDNVRPPSQQHIGDFIGNSSYKTFYKNYGPPDTLRFKRPPHISVSDQIQFQTSSLYQDSFCKGLQSHPNEKFRQTTELTPLPFGQTFQYQTQSQAVYQPFKILQIPKLTQEFPKPNDGPKYDGQFKSLFNKDFTPKINKICPYKDYKKQVQTHLQDKQGNH